MSEKTEIQKELEASFAQNFWAWVVGLPLSLCIFGYVSSIIDSICVSWGLLEMATSVYTVNGAVQTMEFLTFTQTATGWQIFLYFAVHLTVAFVIGMIVTMTIMWIVDNWDMIIDKVKEGFSFVVNKFKGNKSKKAVLVND